jgi:ATP-dependent DNA helicase RecG
MHAVQLIKGVGEQLARELKKINLDSVESVVGYIPRKFEDYSTVAQISAIQPGKVTIQARLSSVTSRYARKGLHITEAIATDTTGSVRVVWFNQPYRAQAIKVGDEYFLSGVFAQNYRKLVLNNPSCELVSSFPLHAARLVPVYRLPKGLRSSQFRRIVKSALEQFKAPETLPSWIVNTASLINRHKALQCMHFPDSLIEHERAKRRLGFEELFELSLASELNKETFRTITAHHVPFNESEVVAFVKELPFSLTDDQRRSSWEILKDMTNYHPMNRLLEGDVGSGKTAVACIAAVNVASQGMQVAFMAPTEILARQHESTLRKILPKSILNSVVFLSGSMSVKEKSLIYKLIKSGQAKVIIGTHALIQSSVEFHSLALVIIDEQHRFGVDQRKALQAKAKHMPHVLHMTATPIPRSVALTLYGELSISILREKPAGRIPVRTKITMPDARPQLYAQVVEEIAHGRQVFVVCPLIKHAEDRTERPLSVEKIATEIQQWVGTCSVATLHGKQKAKDKESIMQEFVEGSIHILVSTTVIEVGVDVPNATSMIIEGADKFGLAQLHQLRGRIGRGKHESTCYLVPTTNDSISRRLRYIESEFDGFKLAEYDLEMRGPGALYGTVQHGALDLRVAKLSDIELIKLARYYAHEFVKRKEDMLKYPQLKERIDHLRTITNLN